MAESSAKLAATGFRKSLGEGRPLGDPRRRECEFGGSLSGPGIVLREPIGETDRFRFNSSRAPSESFEFAD